MITEPIYPKTQTSEHPYLFPSSQSLDLTRHTYETLLNLSPFYPYYHHPNSGNLHLLTRLLQQSSTCSSLSSLHFLWTILLHTLNRPFTKLVKAPQRFLNAFRIKVHTSKKTASLDSLHLVSTPSTYTQTSILTSLPPALAVPSAWIPSPAHSQWPILANLLMHHFLFMSPSFLNLVRFVFRSPYAILYYWTNKMIPQLSV